MQIIVPHLWYDTEAKEAAELYTSLFKDSSIDNVTVIENTPSGDAEMVSFTLAGMKFEAISAGPYFQFNPSISLMVACESKEEVDAKWEALSDGGVALMPLAEYPFSKWFGWIQDRYGLSWQLMLVDEMPSQKITPHFLFSGQANGKAEEAITFYTDLFEDAGVSFISRHETDEGKSKVYTASFELEGLKFSAMDHMVDETFTFNEAFSFIILCEDQDEIDFFWEELSAVPEAEQCGWVKDKFGVSWQIIPRNMNKLLFSGSKEEIRRTTETMLQMKKIDIQALEDAKGAEQ